MVDETVRWLAIKAFRSDSIAGTRYVHATSMVSSAYERHGKILEVAMFERLCDNNLRGALSTGPPTAAGKARIVKTNRQRAVR
jgi:hypothetical protein